MTISRYFATCARGLEPILAEELHQIGGQSIEQGRGGVAFAGDRRLLYRANLALRTAVRVLMPLGEYVVHSPDELYEAVRSIDWSQLMTTEQTLAVDCNVRDSKINHSQYAARRVKDAICDQFRDATGLRPSVDVERPMLGLNLHVYKNRAILSLDSSWESLHKRGYRPVLTRAPLNEALAAALVLRTGWRGERPFVDPMAGSGTLPIEAAWIALNRPPGLTRKHFGFMGWRDFEMGEFAAVRDELRAGVKAKLDHPILGADQRRDAFEFSEGNARTAGVGHVVKFELAEFRHWQLPAEPGVLVVNPPYGERLGEEKELISLYRALGDLFKTRLAGWDCWVFTGNPVLADAVGIAPLEELPFFNGKIPCRFLHFRC